MNTFALILLAFPLYLAVNGKLTEYVALAATAAAQPTNTAPTNTAPTTATASSTGG